MRIILPSFDFLKKGKKKLSRHLFMKCEKDADFPALLEFIEKSRLPAIFDSDMKQGCGIALPSLIC